MTSNISVLLHMPPEFFDPELAKPKKQRVLLLASYCETDAANCSNDHPCGDCLQMCNVAEVTIGLDDIVGQFGV